VCQKNILGDSMRFLLLAILLLSSIQPALAENKEQLFDAYFSVVMIRGYNATGGLSYGSGVVVGKDQVITNCHVFRSTKEPWISRGEDTYAITSVKADIWHDLCLVNTVTLPFKPALLGSSVNLKRGQEIVAFGHSNGVPAPLTSTGVVKALFDGSPGKVIRSTAQFRMGASGSGLFDTEGRLVGINTFKTAGTGGSIYFALPIEWLDKLEKQTEVTTFPITGKALWEEDEDKKPFYMQAAVPESRQDWPKLEEVAIRWTKSEPNNTEAWTSLGLAQEEIGRAQDAEAAYKHASDVDSSNYEALVKVGTLAKARGDTAEMHRVQTALSNIDKELGAEYSTMLGCNKEC
jgi:serine protease Do